MKKKCCWCRNCFDARKNMGYCTAACSKAGRNLRRRNHRNKKQKTCPVTVLPTVFTPSSIPHNQEVLLATGATDNSLEVMKLQLESKKLDVEAKKIDLEMNLLELKKLDVESGKMEMKQSNTQDQLNALNILNGVSSGRVFISNGVKLVPDWY